MNETPFDARTYFSETETDDVRGFAILARQTSGGSTEYHIGEKWLGGGADGSDLWIDYWVPQSELIARIEAGECEEAGSLSDEQYDAVCENVGWDYTENETPADSAEEAPAAA